MKNIKLHYLIGDVHLGGHDVRHIAVNNKVFLDKTVAFDVTMVCDDPQISEMSFDEYFASEKMEQAEVFVFNCGNYRFNCTGSSSVWKMR